MRRNLLFILMLASSLLGWSATDGQIRVLRFSFSEADNGLRTAVPELMVWSNCSDAQTVTFNYKLTNPKGSIVRYIGSPQGYSTSASVEVTPGLNTVALPNLSHCNESLFVDGTYNYEVWMNQTKALYGTFDYQRQVVTQTPVQPQPTQPEKPEVVEPEPVAQQPVIEQPVVKPEVKPEEKPQPVVTEKPKKEKSKPEPMKLHFGLAGGIAMGSFNLSATGQMGSVVDYGLVGIPDFIDAENPDYQFNTGYIAGAFVQFPLVENKNYFMEAGVQYGHLSYTNKFANDGVWLNFDDASFGMDYGRTENYTLNYINVPILFGYEFAFSDLISIDVKTGPVIGILASAKLETDGYSNYDMYTFLEDHSWGYYGHANSDITGYANLLTGAYDFDQTFTTGNHASFHMTNATNHQEAIPAYKRINGSWRFGASVNIGPAAIYANYDLGILNMANAPYWDSTTGARVPGLFLVNESYYSDAAIKDYSQKLGVFNVGLSVRF